MSVHEATKVWCLATISLILLPAVAGAILGVHLRQIQTNGGKGISKFSSYEELKAFLKKSQGSGVAYWPTAAGFLGLPSVKSAITFRAEVGETDSSLNVGQIEYSATNVQVEGIDEADIIKTDGEYIYLVSDQRLLLIRAYPPERMELISEVRLEGNPVGLYISGDRLVTIEQMYRDAIFTGEDGNMILPQANVSFRVYDTSNKSKPVLRREYAISGFYSASRMLEPYVYSVVVEPAVMCKDEVFLPELCGQGWIKKATATEIYYYNESSEGAHSFVTILAINVQDESVEPTCKTFLAGASDVIYMSYDNMYISQSIWRTALSTGQTGGSIGASINANQGYEVTVIHKLHVDGLSIEYVARGEARGFPLNQFSMDEHEGFFRIATTSHADYELNSILKEVNNIYVFDSDMNLVGSLEDLAPGERIHSARFVGDLCYLVTFKKVDPLFVIDLASPERPKVLGKLKIPGYSDYLHPFGEGFLIGVGKETVEAEEGDFAWYQGLKISLFDVRQLDDPREISKLVIGDRGTDSPVLYDHKAFLLDIKRGLLVLPVLVAEIDPSDYPDGVPRNAYGEFTWQGVYVLNVSEKGGIEVRGRITHMDGNDDLLKSGIYFYSERSVKRALYIGGVLYTISEDRIKANDLSTLEELNVLSLKR